jgi:hypothetical protein
MCMYPRISPLHLCCNWELVYITPPPLTQKKNCISENAMNRVQAHFSDKQNCTSGTIQGQRWP